MKSELEGSGTRNMIEAITWVRMVGLVRRNLNEAILHRSSHPALVKGYQWWGRKRTQRFLPAFSFKQLAIQEYYFLRLWVLRRTLYVNVYVGRSIDENADFSFRHIDFFLCLQDIQVVMPTGNMTRVKRKRTWLELQSSLSLANKWLLKDGSRWNCLQGDV